MIAVVKTLALPITTGVLVLFVAGVVHAAGGGDEHGGEILKEILFQTLNLAILLGVLVYFGRKPISEFFASRRDGIASELSDAANLLSEAERRNSELQRRLVELDSETEEIRNQANRRASEEAEGILADARATAERIRNDAQAAVAQELRRAQANLRDEAADLALEIAARKLSETVEDSDLERLVDEFITRIEPNVGEGTMK